MEDNNIVIGSFCSTAEKDTYVYPKEIPGYVAPEPQILKEDNQRFNFIYTPIEYSIGYNLDGGEIDVDLKSSYTIEDDTYIPPIPTRKDFVFNGWEPKSIPAGTIGDINFTATWKSLPILKTGTELNKIFETIAGSKDNILGFRIVDYIDNCVDISSTITPIYASYDDGIINLAGKYTMNSLVEIDYNKFEEIFKINFFGCYLINKTFLPLLAKGSRIVTITSELAPLNPLPFTGIYAITKSTLDKYCYSLRMELQLLGIDVSVIRAGAVKTNMLNASTKSLEEFCHSTKIYDYNANKFKQIVDKIETKNIPPEKLAKKVAKVLNSKKTKFAYKINANFYLRLLNIMPKKFQFWVIKKILSSK